MDVEETHLLTVREYALRFNIPDATVRSRIRLGKLPTEDMERDGKTQLGIRVKSLEMIKENDEIVNEHQSLSSPSSAAIESLSMMMINDYQERVKELSEENKRLSEQLESLRSELSFAREQLAGIKGELKGKDGLIQAKEEIINAKDQAMNAMNGTLLAMEGNLPTLQIAATSTTNEPKDEDSEKGWRFLGFRISRVGF